MRERKEEEVTAEGSLIGKRSEAEYSDGEVSLSLIYTYTHTLQPHLLFMSIEGVAGGSGRESPSSLEKAPGPRMGPPNLLEGNPTMLLLS